MNYENAFILISHDIPFLNSVINLIYHMENHKLDRLCGGLRRFPGRCTRCGRRSCEAAYQNASSRKSLELKDFVARNKARVSTRNMAMSRQKKLDKMELIEKQVERGETVNSTSTWGRTPGQCIFETKGLVIGYDDAAFQAAGFRHGAKVRRLLLTGANGIGKTTLLKSIAGTDSAVGRSG